MPPPKQFWPFYDDEELEIYDNPLWDLPGHTRRPDQRAPRPASVPLRSLRVKS